MSKQRIGSADIDFDGLTIEGPAGLSTVEPKVMEVLQFLASKPDEVVTRDNIIDEVWGAEFGGDERLSRAISLLRKALGDTRGQHSHIQTVPKRGYRLTAKIVAPDTQQLSNGAAPSHSTPATQAGTPGRRGQEPTLAILPFLNMAGLPEIDVFAFGMAEDLIDALSQGTDVRVKASSATARFGTGPTPDLQAMADQLNVRYVLQGNIRLNKDDLRITTQLVEARHGDVLWNRRFETPRERLAEMQEELVLSVAAHLRTQAHRVEIERALKKPGNLTAWQAIMRSISCFRRLTPESTMQALTEARLAVSIDPEYGLAQALVAQIEAILYNQLVPDTPGETERIRDQAEEALRLDPDRSTVVSTAASAMTIAGYPEAGLAAAKRAMELNPNNQYAYAAAGMAATLLDRSDDAISYLDHELSLAPNDVTTWISYSWRCNANIRASRWAEAGDAIDAALGLTPDNAAPNIDKAVILTELGQRDEAQKFIAQARKCEPGTPLTIWELRFGRAYINSSMGQEFLSHLRELWAASETDF